MKEVMERLRNVVAGLIPEDRQKQLDVIAEVCEAAAMGDLESRVVGLAEDPALGRLATALNHLLDISDAYVRESAAAMEACSKGCYHRPILRQGMAGAYRKSSSTINRAALKMKTDAGQIAAFQAERQRVVDDVTETTQSIAAACEELTATTSEISRQAETSARLTDGAVGEADRTLSAVDGLVAAAGEIESVVTLISRIASETKLLALNASIEAARAGANGACFAVVAQEVKTLSQGTGDAIENIEKLVERLRSSCSGVHGAIRQISGPIHQIHGNANTISTSVGEQVQATGEIAHRIESVLDTMRALQGGAGAAGGARGA